jgi:ubiquitin carboxyl-terminal hydrolase 5/13
MDAMNKTEKTIAEMEIDQNMSYEFNRLQESGKELSPLYGPGYTGMVNIGSSCYLASVMQVIFTIPQFLDRYVKPAEEFFRNAPSEPHTDFQIQMAKLGNSLHSGKYSIPDNK